MKIRGIKRGHHVLEVRNIPGAKKGTTVVQKLVHTFQGGLGGMTMDVRDAKRSHYYSALGRAR
jgi:hypothetical protein